MQLLNTQHVYQSDIYMPLKLNLRALEQLTYVVQQLIVDYEIPKAFLNGLEERVQSETSYFCKKTVVERGFRYPCVVILGEPDYFTNAITHTTLSVYGDYLARRVGLPEENVQVRALGTDLDLMYKPKDGEAVSFINQPATIKALAKSYRTCKHA